MDVGYEMVDSQRGVKCRVGFNYLISNKHEWNNNYCFIKNSQRIAIFELPCYTCWRVQSYHTCICGPWYISSWPVYQSKLRNCNIPWLAFNNDICTTLSSILRCLSHGEGIKKRCGCLLQETD